VHLSLSANPSHLEAINPVIEGMVRAKQNHLGDVRAARVVPVLMHGDAAFTGQGIVSRRSVSRARGLSHRRTIHIIVNNQIGFTTPPEAYRFTPYPSDVAKIIQAPVFHVNGDDPEAAVQAARLAIPIPPAVQEGRHHRPRLLPASRSQRARRSDLHAAGDVSRDRRHPTPLTLYRQRLGRREVVTDADVDRRLKEFAISSTTPRLRARLHAAAAGIRVRRPVARPRLGGRRLEREDRGVRRGLNEITAAMQRTPEGFHPNPKVMKLMEQRATMVRDGQRIDWGCAEALAIGALVLEGVPVRMSGRTSGAARSAIATPSSTTSRTAPATCRSTTSVPAEQVLIFDSMLSENAVLGFEFGFSVADPHKLVIWEAQFGDFANGAQVIVDQFISSSESKWQRMSGS
jgi:2-oxoglutarate dehydrogenase E1 component